MRVAMCVMLCELAVAGCGSDATSPAPASNAPIYVGLHFNWNAVNLALASPYNTVQLVATPVDQTGAPLTDAPAPQYSSIDSNVTTSATGLVTAHSATGQTQVTAKLTIGNVTFADTANIRVTATPILVDTFSIQPRPGWLEGDSVDYDQYYSINNYNGNIPVYATDAEGNALCDGFQCPFLVSYSSSNPNVSQVNRSYGYLNPYIPGKFTVTASTFVYGVGKRDSLHFNLFTTGDGFAFIPNKDASNHIIPFPLPTGTLRRGVGSNIYFNNRELEQPLEITIQNRTNQITRLYVDAAVEHQLADTAPPGGAIYLRFDSAGVYSYHARVLDPNGGSIYGTVTITNP